MNGAISAFPVSLDSLAWRASVAITMWHLVLPKHVTKVNARMWRWFSIAQAKRRGVTLTEDCKELTVSVEELTAN
jgi:hypothetical protein